MSKIRSPMNSMDLLLTSTLMLLSLFLGCGRGSKLSDTAKSVFFTDRRPFDLALIEQDINRLNEAISSNTEDARLLVARGFIYAALNEFNSAISDLERAATIDADTDTADPYAPKKSGVYYLLAIVYWQSGNVQKAVSYFSKVIDTDSMHSRSYFYRGMAKLVLGDKTGAADDIEKASNLGREPYYTQALQELRGVRSREHLLTTYVVCFHPNKPPQNRPFGYIWEIKHEIREQTE